MQVPSFSLDTDLLIDILGFHIHQYSLHRFTWWLGGKEFACQCRRHGFDPWVRKIPCKRKWQPTPVFLSGKFHRQRRLGATDHEVTKETTQLND